MGSQRLDLHFPFHATSFEEFGPAKTKRKGRAVDALRPFFTLPLRVGFLGLGGLYMDCGLSEFREVVDFECLL
jgi:hypothetical protein